MFLSGNKISDLLQERHVVENYNAIYNIIGRAGASPPSRATGARNLYVYIYIYVRRCNADTVISISP